MDKIRVRKELETLKLHMDTLENWITEGDMDKIFVRKQLENLKLDIDYLENWICQANNIVYSIEEKILDKEDREIFEFFDFSHRWLAEKSCV